MNTESQPSSQRVELGNDFCMMIDGELIPCPYPSGWAPFSNSFEPVKTQIAQSISKILEDES